MISTAYRIGLYVAPSRRIAFPGRMCLGFNGLSNRPVRCAPKAVAVVQQQETVSTAYRSGLCLAPLAEALTFGQVPGFQRPMEATGTLRLFVPSRP